MVALASNKKQKQIKLEPEEESKGDLEQHMLDQLGAEEDDLGDDEDIASILGAGNEDDDEDVLV